MMSYPKNNEFDLRLIKNKRNKRFDRKVRSIVK